MKKIIAALAAAAAVAAASLTVGAPAHAATYAADASLTGTRTCVDATGYTKQQVTLSNVRSSKRAQFKVVREGDARAPHTVYVWVGAGAKKVVTVTVPEQQTVSVRVRVPEMGQRNLVLSATVAHLGGKCHKEVYAPQASLSGLRCWGGDSAAKFLLDNRKTTDAEVEFDLVASGDGINNAQSSTVPPLGHNSFILLTGPESIHVTVSADGKVLFDQDVTAKSC